VCACWERGPEVPSPATALAAGERRLRSSDCREEGRRIEEESRDGF
jgi:hypothetical protein